MCEECIRQIAATLDKMEVNGAFRYLSPDKQKIERKMIALRLRSEIRCPENEDLQERATIQQQDG